MFSGYCQSYDVVTSPTFSRPDGTGWLSNAWLESCRNNHPPVNCRIINRTSDFVSHGRQANLVAWIPRKSCIYFVLVLSISWSIGVIVAAARNSTRIHFVGATATLILVATGVVDITKTPGIAIGIILLGICTAVTTIAAIAGRHRSVTTSL